MLARQHKIRPAPSWRVALVVLPLVLALSGSEADAQGQLYSFNVSTSFNPAESARYAGDVNMDGHPDVIVSGLSGNSVRVFSGSDGSLIHLLFGASSFGDAVSGAGDVNQDGYDDLIVGAPGDDTENGTNSGSATLIDGETGDQLFKWLGDSGGDAFGFSVSGAGDVDFNGYPDVIVGAPMNDVNGGNTGSAYVYSGMDYSEIHAFHSFSSGDRLGNSVAGAGDVNMDDHDDLIVGLEDSDPTGKSSGSAYVYSGANGFLLLAFNGDTGGDEMGRSVGPAGDGNQDGHADIIVGSPGDSPNDIHKAGNATVFSGFDGDTLFRWDGEEIGEALGSSVAEAGDVNGDGYTDYIVGAPLSDPNGASSGRAAVFLGTTGELIYSLDGASAGQYLGHAVDGVHDVNDDGFDDLIVGAKASVAVYSGRSVFLPGDFLVGEIKPSTDKDAVRFFAFKGMGMKLELEVTSGSLRPIVEIVNDSGNVVQTWTFLNSNAIQKKSVTLHDSGEFRIRVRSLAGTSGKYEINTIPVFPSKAKGFAKVRNAGRNKKIKSILRSLPGTVLDAFVTPKRRFVNPPVVALTTPLGVVYDVSAFTTVEFGNVIHLTGVPLLEVGIYELTVFGEARKSRARVEVTLDQPVGSATVPID